MPFASLSARDRRPERMDAPDLDPAAHHAALAGLARLNRLSGSAAVVWPSLAKLARAAGGEPVRVLDVATGGGDVPVRLAAKAKRAGLNLHFSGCDVSDTAVSHARDAAKAAGVPVEFFAHDALAAPLPAGFDAVTCSLFLHHLDEPDAVKLLAAMAAAGRTVLVNDLARGPVNYALVWAASRLVTRSPVVHEDGPLSVRAAFTRAEILALAEQAGLTGAVVKPRFPCRFLLTWSRP
jgi:2-polyprenyl-3-methyl-5-hydroxy-6-metoxy-1,4-benzoquinol methylase